MENRTVSYPEALLLLLEYKDSEETADEEMIREGIRKQLFAGVSGSHGRSFPKVLTRAAMAKCLSILPIYI